MWLVTGGAYEFHIHKAVIRGVYYLWLQLKMVTLYNKTTSLRTILRVRSRTDHIPQIEDSDSLNLDYLLFISAKHG